MKILSLIIFFALPCFGGIVEPLVKWKKTNVTVCFADSNKDLETKVDRERSKGLKFISLTDTEKDLVIRTIESEYTRDKTIITFSGWEDCVVTPSPDAIISKAKITKFLGIELSGPTFQGESSIGQDGDDRKSYSMPTGKTALIILMDFNSVTIAHEFGHLAGLRHEHIHPDASLDQRCLKYFKLSSRSYNSYFSKSSDRFYENTKSLTDYDPNSIMNYCAIQRLKTPRSELLTELDQQALKTLYSWGISSPNL